MAGGPYLSGIPTQALPLAPGGMKRMFCLFCSTWDGRTESPCARSRSLSAISPKVIDNLRGGDFGGVTPLVASFSTRCHLGVTSILHLTQRRSGCSSSASSVCETPSSPSDFVSLTEDVLAPRRTAAAMLFAVDSLLLPLAVAGASCCPLSFVS